MPTGIFPKKGDDVKQAAVAKIATIPLDDASSNDFFDGIRIVLEYIIAEKRRKRKGKFRKNI